MIDSKSKFYHQSKQCSKSNQFKNVVCPKGHCNKVKVMASKDLVNAIECKNRFSPLADINDDLSVFIDKDRSVVPENSSDRNIVSKKRQKSAESVPLASQPTGPIKVAKTNQNCNEILDDRDTKWSNHRTIDKDAQVSVINLCNTESVIDATKAGKDYVKRVDVNKLDYKCQDLQKCLSQQYNAFGFLPLNNLKKVGVARSLRPNKAICNSDFSPVEVHREVRATGKYNYQKAKILLPSPINFQLFEHLAKDYWDWELPLMLKYGFPLCFPHNEKDLESGEINHSSAMKYPAHVETYLTTEMSQKAIYGPFQDPPYGETTHISPFMSRDKADSETRRIITDLSWPLGASVNHFTPHNIYNDTVYKLTYPNVDNITNCLASLGEGAVMYKIDLSRAFRQIRIDPFDYNLLCLKWGDQYFSDGYCPFGHRNGSLICTRLTFFSYLMYQRGSQLFSYVDDLIGCGLPHKASADYKYLLKTLEDLDFPVSAKKLVEPCEECNCLGVIVNARKPTISIPEGKAKKILEVYKSSK